MTETANNLNFVAGGTLLEPIESFGISAGVVISSTSLVVSGILMFKEHGFIFITNLCAKYTGSP